MADYSYVTVTVEDTPVSRAILEDWRAERLGDVFLESAVKYGEDDAQIALVQLVVEEARYGFPGVVLGDQGWEHDGYGDADVAVLLLDLMDAGVAWEGYDGGGYEWPEAEYAWKPGDGTVRSRILDGTGIPVLTLNEWQRILKDIAHPDSFGAVEVVEAVKHHFRPLAVL